MKRVFTVMATMTVLVWTGSGLWLAGYEQGYEQGTHTAWKRANRTMHILSRLQQSAADNGISLAPKDQKETPVAHLQEY